MQDKKKTAGYMFLRNAVVVNAEETYAFIPSFTHPQFEDVPASANEVSASRAEQSTHQGEEYLVVTRSFHSNIHQSRNGDSTLRSGIFVFKSQGIFEK